MVLAEPVLNVVPAQIYRDTPLVGDELTIVGFGGTGGVEGGDGSFGVKRAGTTVIQEIEPTRVIWYFDEEDEANTATATASFLDTKNTHESGMEKDEIKFTNT